MCAALLSSPATAAWDPDGVPICVEERDQTHPVMVPSPPGAIVLWRDERDGPGRTGIYMSFVRPTRSLDYERLVTPSTPVFSGAGSASVPRAIPDGRGGAFITWSDDRGGTGDENVFVQRVRRDGELWASYVWDGNHVCTAPGSQIDPTIAADGEGGFFIAWSDSRADSVSGADISVQRFYDYGAPVEGWPLHGRRVCSAPGDQVEPSLIADGSGGILIVWRDSRSDPAGDLFAVGIDASGTTRPGWASDGNAVCSEPDRQDEVSAVEDGSGDAYVAWRDRRSGPYSESVFLLRVSATGGPAPGWPSGGIPLDVGGLNLVTAPAIARDPAGGVYIAWCDSDGKAETGARIQRVLGDGSLSAGWPQGGRLVGAPVLFETRPALFADPGGAIVVWSDPTGVGVDLRAQRIDLTGAVARHWPAWGVVLSDASGYQALPAYATGWPAGGPIVSDGSGGAMVAWTDFRYGRVDIYGQWVDGNGTVAPGDPPCSFDCPPSIVSRLHPNPTRGPITMKIWAPAEDPTALLDVVDIRGRIVRTVARDDLPVPGYVDVSMDLSGLPAGVYFVRLRPRGEYEDFSLGTRKIVLMR